MVGFYAWVVTAAFGATLMDVAYAAQVAGDRAVVLGDVSDLLLAVTAMTVVVAIGAIAVCWGRKRARNLLIASLAVVAVGLLTPILLSGIVRGAEDLLDLRVGPWVRLGEAGLASILAFAGLWESWRKA